MEDISFIINFFMGFFSGTVVCLMIYFFYLKDREKELNNG